MAVRLSLECPGGCKHTDSEHDAFDLGKQTGETNPDAGPVNNPFNAREQFDESLAWQIGLSTGAFNRIHKTDKADRSWLWKGDDNNAER